MKTTDIKGKPYVQVNERLKHFRSQPEYKGYSLTSEILFNEDGCVVIKAIILDDNNVVRATGLAMEKEGSTFINKTSHIENCETSAWGRALGNLGIGIDTSVASAEEVGNAVKQQEADDLPDVLKKNRPIKNKPSIAKNFKTLPKMNDIQKAIMAEVYLKSVLLKPKDLSTDDFKRQMAIDAHSNLGRWPDNDEEAQLTINFVTEFYKEKK